MRSGTPTGIDIDGVSTQALQLQSPDMALVEVMEPDLFVGFQGKRVVVSLGIGPTLNLTREPEQFCRVAASSNKMFVADNHVAIIGGRNIGNEYFGFNPEHNFRDLELLVVGPVAQDLSASFDLYWNSELAYPGAGMTKKAMGREDLQALRALVAEQLKDAQSMLGDIPLAPQDWKDELRLLEDEMSAGPGWSVYDKAPDAAGPKTVRVVASLYDLVPEDDAKHEVLIGSAYYVPDQALVDEIREFTGRGVRIKIFTNSLASVDTAGISNAFYKRWRKPTVQAGAELYELRHDARDRALSEAPTVQAEFLALHSKFIVIDRTWAYVGSLNITPRSIYLNTENGVLAKDPVLGEQVARIFERDVHPDNAWRVRLDEEGELYWESSAGVVHRQPARSFWHRVRDGFFGILPLDNQI